MSVPAHGKKEVRKAIKEAKAEGWELEYIGKGHNYGRLRCPENMKNPSLGHKVRIHGSPKSETTMANRIREAVRRCDHKPTGKKK